MGLFDKLFKKSEPVVHDDSDIVAVCHGKMVPASQISDAVFAQEMMGQTIAFEPVDGTIVAPCNGTVEALFPTGHAFGIKMKDGTGLLVHIGIDTVNMNGKGFKVLAKQGDVVSAGQKIVKVDLEAVKEAGHPRTVMLIVTDKPTDDFRVDYIDYGNVTQGQKINK